MYETPVTTQVPGAATITIEVLPTKSHPSGVPEDVPIMPDAYELRMCQIS